MRYGITYIQTINNTDKQTLMITLNILILKLGNLTLPWETKLSLSKSKHSIWNPWTNPKTGRFAVYNIKPAIKIYKIALKK